ncbi:MAG: hypothetical protein JNJ90_19275 [Saprospiraceae bacterium]|jgi:hydroxymethylbilane synthase|nr:hypothetical protein [Saprospiraceae bacterium]
MIKIGIQDFPATRRLAEFARQELICIGVESTVVFLDDLEGGILRGDIDAALQPLGTIPLERPGEVVIAALSARENPADLLVMHPETQDNRLDFGLKQGAVVCCATAWQAAQLRDFRPDLAVSVPGGGVGALVSGLKAGICEAIVFAAADMVAEELDLSGLLLVELNPREFLPTPGQGVVAWLAHRDNLPVRRLLKQVHHPDVSACTNVERRVLQLLRGALLGAFVERDAAGNFHAFVAGETGGSIRRARLSQSTNFELAERVVAGLG